MFFSADTWAGGYAPIAGRALATTAVIIILVLIGALILNLIKTATDLVRRSDSRLASFILADLLMVLIVLVALSAGAGLVCFGVFLTLATIFYFPLPCLTGSVVLLAIGLARGILPRWLLVLGRIIAKHDRNH